MTRKRRKWGNNTLEGTTHWMERHTGGNSTLEGTTHWKKQRAPEEREGRAGGNGGGGKAGTTKEGGLCSDGGGNVGGLLARRCVVTAGKRLSTHSRLVGFWDCGFGTWVRTGIWKRRQPHQGIMDTPGVNSQTPDATTTNERYDLVDENEKVLVSPIGTTDSTLPTSFWRGQ